MCLLGICTICPKFCSDVVVEARPWPRGASGCDLEGPDLGFSIVEALILALATSLKFWESNRQNDILGP